jgi:serine/threonine protein kinase
MVDIVLEYVSGGSVRKLLDKFTRLEEKVIGTYTRQVLEGLTYLHMNGIVHRNVKGSNILIDTSGVIKLTDFGCSGRPDRFSEDNPQDINKTLSLPRGPPYWSAPEVVMRKSQGKPADVWSVGCIVIEMLTGLPPWTNSSRNLDEFIKQISLGTPPPFPADISENCRDFLFKTFKFKPEDRPSPLDLLEHPFVREDLLDNSYMEAESLQTIQTFQSNYQMSNLLHSDSKFGGEKKYMEMKTNNFVARPSTNISMSNINLGRLPSSNTNDFAGYISREDTAEPKFNPNKAALFEKDPNFMSQSNKFNRPGLKKVAEAQNEDEFSPQPGAKSHFFQFTGSKTAIPDEKVEKVEEPHVLSKEERRRQLEEEMHKEMMRINTGQLSDFAVKEEESQEYNNSEQMEKSQESQGEQFKKKGPPVPLKNSLFFGEHEAKSAGGPKEDIKEMGELVESQILQVRTNYQGHMWDTDDVEVKSSSYNPKESEANERKREKDDKGTFQRKKTNDLKKLKEDDEIVNQVSEADMRALQERLRKQYEEQLEISLRRINSEKLQQNSENCHSEDPSYVGDNMKMSDKIKKPYEDESSSQIVRLSSDNAKDTWKIDENGNVLGNLAQLETGNLKAGWDESHGYDIEVSPQMTESEGKSPDDYRAAGKKPIEFIKITLKEANSASSKNESFDKNLELEGAADIRSSELEIIKAGGEGSQATEENDEKLGIINEAEEIKEDSAEEEDGSHTKPESRNI